MIGFIVITIIIYIHRIINVNASLSVDLHYPEITSKNKFIRLFYSYTIAINYYLHLYIHKYIFHFQGINDDCSLSKCMPGLFCNAAQICVRSLYYKWKINKILSYYDYLDFFLNYFKI